MTKRKAESLKKEAKKDVSLLYDSVLRVKKEDNEQDKCLFFDKDLFFEQNEDNKYPLKLQQGVYAMS